MTRRPRRAAEQPSAATAFRPRARAFRPIDVLSEEEEARVHALSLHLLEKTGIQFQSSDTWAILEANGCLVDRGSGLTRFPPGVIDHFLAFAPSEFTMPARNPANSLHFGGEHIHFGSASSAPNVTDAERGRRPGTQADFEALVKLNQMLGTCAFIAGHPVEPIDAAPNTRHLTSGFAWHTLSDKVTRVYAIGRTRVRDSVEMVRIAHGLSEDEVRAAPRLQAAININSPLVMDAPMIEAAMELALAGQVNVISPVAFAGAMSPVSLSGSIIQCNAECIAVIAFLQMVKAGAPCFYGVLTTPINMKSGAPVMGAPETVQGTLANGQMARRYKLPQRVMLGSTSNAPDAQAAYESMFSLWAAELSGAHMVYHAHGWMEAGLTTGYEKTIIDSEMIGMMGALRGRIDFSDTDEIMETIAAVGPAGHFLDTPHTVARYATEFHPPIISDWRSFEAWHQDGARDTAARATQRWKDMLAAYTPPPMDEGTREELAAFVARRTSEIGGQEI
ncbi:MAG: trimethylamine methyltransferase family protein [Alphaproteobacteria bacterium]|nr:trimethylamine methyltransferase family protein [Alphaproteobacteria bacterium]